MFIEKIRTNTRLLMDAIAKFIHKFSNGKIKANHITLIALYFHILIALAIVANQLVLAAAMLFVFGLFDALDGALARLQKTASKAGMFLDASTDRIKEAMVFIALTYVLAESHGVAGATWTITALSAAMSVSYIKAKGEVAVSEEMKGLNANEINQLFKGGLMRLEIRTLLVIIGLLFNVLYPVVIIIAVLSWLTAFYRLASIYRRLSIK